MGAIGLTVSELTILDFSSGKSSREDGTMQRSGSYGAKAYSCRGAGCTVRTALCIGGDGTVAQ